MRNVNTRATGADNRIDQVRVAHMSHMADPGPPVRIPYRQALARPKC
ncbi:hypothetical protein BH24CHL3_BH24CHL3_09450 [soil metagenome]